MERFADDIKIIAYAGNYIEKQRSLQAPQEQPRQYM